MVDGKPDFAALLKRQRIRTRGTANNPVTFVAFDLVYHDFDPIINEPCETRRALLQQLLPAADSRIVMSRSVAENGKLYFEQVKAMGLEGVVAKRRDSRYEPGKRSGAWQKFKGTQTLVCSIIGYEPSEQRGMRSLIIAALLEGELRWVGQVGSGITEEMHERLLSLLNARLSQRPIVPCTIKGKWVVPDLFCKVSFLEWSKTGKLRGPVFESLHGD
jgi:bifunctional non-homologous end joining protein LigD